MFCLFVLEIDISPFQLSQQIGGLGLLQPATHTPAWSSGLKATGFLLFWHFVSQTISVRHSYAISGHVRAQTLALFPNIGIRHFIVPSSCCFLFLHKITNIHL